VRFPIGNVGIGRSNRVLASFSMYWRPGEIISPPTSTSLPLTNTFREYRHPIERPTAYTERSAIAEMQDCAVFMESNGCKTLKWRKRKVFLGV
jgi:hypothetical protein